MSDTTTEKQETEAEPEAEAAETAEEKQDEAAEEAKPAEETKDSKAADGLGDDLEPMDEEAMEEALPPPEPTPEELLEQSRAATKAMKEKMLRVAADFENYRRRSNKEMEEARKRGTQNAIKDLLPVFDNLERATGHVDEATDAKSMADGLRMVHKQFIDVLAKIGIERVEALGKGFDPNVHESIQYEYSDEYDAGLVMNVLQPGYKHGAMLIRPAMVQVSRGPTPPPAADEEKAEETAEAAEATEEKPETEASEDGEAAEEAKPAEESADAAAEEAADADAKEDASEGDEPAEDADTN